MSSSVKTSSEKKQQFASNLTSEIQSSKPRNLTKSQVREVNPPNAASGIVKRASNGLPISEKDVSQLQLVAAPSAKTPIGRRLTGVLGGARRAQDASGPPVTQRPFRADEVRQIKKNRYDAYKEAVHTSLEAKWHDSIHPKLRKNVEAVIQGIGLQPKEMVVCVGLSMVGPKVGDMLHLVPTIVISCAHEKARMRIEQLIDSGQLDYLREFACPYLVCIRERDPKNRDRFFAETGSCEEVDSIGDITKYDLSSERQKFLKVNVEQFTGLRSACGLRIEFVYPVQHDQHDGDLQNEKFEHQCRMMARIGGTIYIGDKAFALTTAHTFLLQESSQESDASSDSYSRNDSDSNNDSDSGNDSDSISDMKLVPLDFKFGEQGEYEADYATNHDAITIQTKTAVWMEKNNLYGSFAFCDLGRRFDCQDPVAPMSPNSDWCTLSMDSINSLTNHYSSEDENGEAVEVTVDEIGSEEIAEAGDVHILDNPENPMLAYMTQTMVSIYFGGKSLNVRRLISKHPLSAGISGCWVIRGKQLLGHIIGGNEFERTAYMVGIQDTKRAIEELTGGNMSLKPTINVDGFVEEPHSVNLEDPQPNVLQNLLTGASEVIEDAENTGQSDSATARDDSDICDAVARDIARYRATQQRSNTGDTAAIEKCEENPPSPLQD